MSNFNPCKNRGQLNPASRVNYNHLGGINMNLVLYGIVYYSLPLDSAGRVLQNESTRFFQLVVTCNGTFFGNFHPTFTELLPAHA